MSADEIDAELLALAGDGSDDEAESVAVSDHIEEKSPSQEPKPSVEHAEEPVSSRRGVAQKVRKRGRKKVSRRELEDELDDLRDDSPSPAASVRSSDMEQSDYDADAPASPESDDGPQYPLEGKFISVADREHVLSLPEIEREQILADRAQEVLKRQQDLQLKKALANRQDSNKHKRKAGAADFEDDAPRKSSRPKIEKRSALDDYKKARQAKGNERSSRIDRRGEPKDGRPHSSASERDADGESEVDWAEPAGHRRDRDEPPPDLKDFERCRVGRSNLAKVCFYPNFETVMKGCFARVSIGTNRETGTNTYRMTQIKGFVEGKPYQLEGSNGKKFSTDQYALVAHGNAEKPWPFSACSDGKLTDAEFQRYKDTLEKEKSRLPRKAWLLQKLDEIHKFLQPQWDEQTLQAKFARESAMREKVNPQSILRRKRETIMARKAEAEANNDAEEIARCTAELEALNNSSSAVTNGNGPPAPKHSPSKPVEELSNQERFARLNQKNRELNAYFVRKALLEERRKVKEDRHSAYEAAKAKALAEAEAKKQSAALLAVPKSGDMKDLFGDSPGVSRSGTPMSGLSTPKRVRSRAGTPLNGIKKEGRIKTGIELVVANHRAEDEDKLADLDFGIDVEI